MFGLGIGELLIVLVIVVVVFNRRLPDVADSLGKSMRRFKNSLHGTDEIDVTPKEEPETRADREQRR